MADTQRKRAPFLGLLPLDLILVGISAVSLIVSCVVVSPAKPFWNDELYSWYFLADPSFSHMWTAFNDQINTTPPLYFVLGWLWAQVAGASELSLRLFSSLGFGVALALVWATLRKAYSFWPTCMGTLVVFLSSEIVLHQNVEARMYGLFLALAAAAVYQYVALNEREGYTSRDLVGIALVHAALVNTHLFGPLYSGAILAAYAVTDLQCGMPRKGVYAAVGVGWLAFLIYLPAFLAHADAGRPRAWLPEPRFSDFFELVGLASPSFVDVPFVVLLVLCLGLIYFFGSRVRRVAGDGRPGAAPAERSLFVMAFALLAVPVLVFVISRKIKPIFWDRYLIPSIISYTIGIAHLTARYVEVRRLPLRALGSGATWQSRGRYLFSRALLAALVVALWANPLLYTKDYQRRTLPGALDGTFGYRDLPMVLQTSAGFLERSYYAPDREHYYFILDEEAAMKTESGQFGPQEYKHMAAFKRNYPDLLGDRILQSDEFLRRFDRFLVLDYANYDEACPSRVFGLAQAREWKGMHCPQWVEMRLLDNPAFTVTHLGDLWGEAVLLVERKQPATAAPPGDAVVR